MDNSHSVWAGLEEMEGCRGANQCHLHCKVYLQHIITINTYEYTVKGTNHR